MKSKQDELFLLQAAMNSEISRRGFLGWSAAAIGALALVPGCGGTSNSTSGPPNILFILSDNQPASMLGCYGNPDIKTPHVDRLATEGVRFTRAFACNGLCSPTRASLMTGLIPSQHGIHDWIDDAALIGWPDDWCAVREFRTLPLTLANRGYQTALIGKYHMGQPRHPMVGFQNWVTFPYGHTINFWNNTIFDNGREYPLVGKHIVEFFAEKGAEYIQKYTGEKPFYLQLNFDGPYLLPPTNLGRDCNRFYLDYYGKDFKTWWPQCEFSKIFEDEIGGRPDDPNNQELHMLYMLKQMHLDPESMANTASQNAVVDYGVGLVMDALKERGVDENTLVIYSTDQADFYNQHGLYGHTNYTIPSSLYDCVLNVPLIMRQPGTIYPNQVSDLMVGQYDMMPTILDHAGFGNVTIDNTPGHSFAPHLKGQPLANWRDDVYFEQEESRGIRTPRFAYWKHLQKEFGPALLYDVESDPGQDQNLFGQPRYEGIVNELDQKLAAFFDRYADPKYDLWKGGKTKSFTGRTDIVNKLFHVGWALDPTIRPPFSEAV
jgi:arylsulfatase A-like enzyme